jgi:hypothetical protein
LWTPQTGGFEPGFCKHFSAMPKFYARRINTGRILVCRAPVQFCTVRPILYRNNREDALQKGKGWNIWKIFQTLKPFIHAGFSIICLILKGVEKKSGGQ